MALSAKDADLHALAEIIDCGLRLIETIGGRTEPVALSLNDGDLDLTVTKQRNLKPTKITSRSRWRYVSALSQRHHVLHEREGTAELNFAHLCLFLLLYLKATRISERSLLSGTLYIYFPRVRHQFGPNNESISQLQTSMMLLSPLNTELSRFTITLQPTTIPNQYHIKTLD